MYESKSQNLWKTAALNFAAYLVSSVTLLPLTIALFSITMVLLLYGLDVQGMRSRSDLSLGEILNFGLLPQVAQTLYFSGDLRWLWAWLLGGVVAGSVASRLRQRYIMLLVGWLACTLVMWIIFHNLSLSPIIAVVLETVEHFNFFACDALNTDGFRRDRIPYARQLLDNLLLPSFVLTQRLIPPLKRIYEWLRHTELSH